MADTDTTLTGRVAIITGASSGIGRAMARRFISEGMRVALAARRVDRLEQLARELGSTRALAIPIDVVNFDQVQRLVHRTLQTFQQVDVMVNNAGYAVEKPLAESSVEEIDGQIDVNLKAVCYGSRAVLPHMLERQTGSIINIGSICSIRHYPDYAAYVAAKFGVLGFSRSLYEEVRSKGVRVHCLCPAAVNTEWADVAGADLPWKRDERLQPEDLAELAVLCLRMPPRVHLDQIVVWPTCESTA